jgi:hypothetical protein
MPLRQRRREERCLPLANSYVTRHRAACGTTSPRSACGPSSRTQAPTREPKPNKKTACSNCKRLWDSSPARNRTWILGSGNLHTIHCTTEPTTWSVLHKLGKKSLTPVSEVRLGDSAGARTQDPLIKSQVLYQLSYRISFFLLPKRPFFKGVANIQCSNLKSSPCPIKICY